MKVLSCKCQLCNMWGALGCGSLKNLDKKMNYKRSCKTKVSYKWWRKGQRSSLH